MAGTARYLLILACSQRKRPDINLLPAIERYDGGSYRVLRKAKKEGNLTPNLDILILSAKHGLIEASTPIADYEQRIDPKRARQLRFKSLELIKNYKNMFMYREVYIDVGKSYIPAIEGLSEIIDNHKIVYAQGRIGERQAKLKLWLSKIVVNC